MIFLAATLAIAQPSDAPIRYDWASFYCQREAALCRLTRRAQADGAVTVAELRSVERRVCPYGILDTGPCGEDGTSPGYAEFIRLLCDDSLYSVIADDRAGLSSEEVMEERVNICSPANRP